MVGFLYVLIGILVISTVIGVLFLIGFVIRKFGDEHYDFTDDVFLTIVLGGFFLLCLILLIFVLYLLGKFIYIALHLKFTLG
jgi:hypothetical protein